MKTAAQLAAGRSTALDAIDLVALLIDGVHIGEHCIIVALGIDHTGAKHALGLWDGSTENATVCQSLLADLQSRGLRTDRSVLVILDGSKALHKAVTQTFGSAALIHRCQVHKLRNILEHLPEGQRPWVRAIIARAYKQVDVAAARRLLQDLARRLEDRYPSAAASVREGLDETLTILTLGLSDRLRQSLATTNAIESLISRTRHVKRNVKRSLVPSKEPTKELSEAAHSAERPLVTLTTASATSRSSIWTDATPSGCSRKALRLACAWSRCATSQRIALPGRGKVDSQG